MAELNPKAVWPGWETKRLIGKGSYGAVYEIERNAYGVTDKAALKYICIPKEESMIHEMLENGFDQAGMTATFKSYLESIINEYALMRKMKGAANIVDCDDFHVVQHDDGIGWDIFIKMELLTPLTKVLEKGVSDEMVCALAKDMCKALILCEKRNIIHRDIKPQNIFVSQDGDYKLGDFGIARTMDGTTFGTHQIGTYNYMAPEVFNNKPYNQTVDIYSLGMVLYWLMNERRLPFAPMPPVVLKAADMQTALNRRMRGEAVPAPRHGNNKLKQIVLKACAYDAQNRYQNAQEMLRDLERIAPSKLNSEYLAIRKASEAGVGPAAPTKKPDTGASLSLQKTLGMNLFADPGQKEAEEDKGPKDESVPEEEAALSLTEEKGNYADQKIEAGEKEPEEEALSQKEEKKKKTKGIIAAVISLVVIGLVILLILLLQKCRTNPVDNTTAADTEATTAETLPVQADWSDWMDELPDYVTGENYTVEEQVLYSSRTLETTSSTTTDTKDGWELYDTVKENGEYGEWSDWSEAEVSPTDNREVQTQKQYRYRDLETTVSLEPTLSGWELKDTSTTLSDWSAWSGWTTDAVSQNNYCDVGTKTQYRYRDLKYTTSSEPSLSGWVQYDKDQKYGEWSDWTDKKISASSTLDVEERKVQTGTRYFIAHYCYKDGQRNGSSSAKHDEYSTYHELGWFDSLDEFHVEDGGFLYYYPNGSLQVCPNGARAYYIINQENVYKTQYRSRSVATTYKYYAWGNWSDYSDTAVSGSSEREVQTRILYRYRTRQDVTTYTYSRWTDWSEWSTDEYVSDDTREAESATFYRYRDRETVTTYYFRRWTDWSDYSKTMVKEDDATEVQTKTQYRYKSK